MPTSSDTILTIVLLAFYAVTFIAGLAVVVAPLVILGRQIRASVLRARAEKAGA